jgi:hypothetical protein
VRAAIGARPVPPSPHATYPDLDRGVAAQLGWVNKLVNQELKQTASLALLTVHSVPSVREP